MSQRRLFIPFVFVLIVSALIGGWFLSSELKKEVTMSRVETTTSAKGTVFPVSENPSQPPDGGTKDWKTYRNETHGFEFKYPQNIPLRTVFPESAGGILAVLGEGFPSIFSIKYLGEEANQAARHLEQRLDLTGNEYRNLRALINDKRWWDHKEIQQITLDREVAYRSVINQGDRYEILVEHNSGIYRLIFPSEKLDPELNAMGNQILSTFRFID